VTEREAVRAAASIRATAAIPLPAAPGGRRREGRLIVFWWSTRAGFQPVVLAPRVFVN